MERTLGTDVFLVSLGVYNTQNGLSADVGMVYAPSENEDGTLAQTWTAYASDDFGFHYGDGAPIDTALFPCVDIQFVLRDNNIVTVFIYNPATHKMITASSFSKLNPELGLTANGTNIGWYRFSTIRQQVEDLQDGSYMGQVSASWWIVTNSTGGFLVTDDMVTQAPFPPGPCCTEEEVSTVTVNNEHEWNVSNVTISYRREF